MKKILLSILIIIGIQTITSAQFIPQKFGKGLQVLGKDSTFFLKLGFRFQNLYTGEWTIKDGSFSDFEGGFLIRRMRLKFDGWAHNPKITYKLELALSNRDNSGGASDEFSNAANIVLDASVAYNFYKNFTIQFGQRKLPGNRERVISSGNLQFVDRSRLNSRFTLDRDMGLQLKHHHLIGEKFLVREIIAFSQGEGRNVTQGHFGGFNYTYRLELLPFGTFQSKGDYVGSAIKFEETPKLSIGLTYDNNKNSVRERGQKGSFIIDSDGNYIGKTLNTFFADMMFKHKKFSLMAEYVHKQTGDDNPNVFDESDRLIGTFYTGTGLNIQAEYMLNKNWELAYRYTDINPDEGVSNDENYYTLAISRYVVGHKLKIQSDFTYLSKELRDNEFIWRTQMDIHF